MDQVALSDVQLNYLGKQDPVLGPVFQGVFPSNELPNNPTIPHPAAYIVNTDPAGEPGRHWLALWTHGTQAEVFDSYALPLRLYGMPLVEQWLEDHWKTVTTNSRAVQALNSQACGHYAFFFLKVRARGHSMAEFLEDFSPSDYVGNDRFIGQALRRVIVRQLEGWEHACRHPSLQCCKSKKVNCTLYKEEE